MTTFALALLFVGAFLRVTLAAFARKHVRSLDLEYKQRAAVLPTAFDVEEAAAEPAIESHGRSLR